MAELFWHDGRWSEQPLGLISPRDDAFWLGSVVFDGARAVRGLAPDLELHCARAVASALAMDMRPDIGPEEIRGLCEEGIRRAGPDAVLYVKPTFYIAGSDLWDSEVKTEFALHLAESPLPGQGGFSATLVPQRRPAPEMAPTDAKAAALYPNSERATRAAHAKGFSTGVVLDPWGNVAEFAYSNLFMAKDGRVLTPEPNGTFLNGITRRRVIGLLRDRGLEVAEARVTLDDLKSADEIFATGNFGKVTLCTRYEDRELNAGPIGTMARTLYWQWAETSRVL